MTDHVQIRQDRERVEQEYDALITQLNRCQGQLSNKEAQAGKLSPLEYQSWFTAKKDELAEIITNVQTKKAHRSEARRKFNGWQPPFVEEWLAWPDCEGHWWFYGETDCESPGFEIFMFCEDGNGKLVVTTGDNVIDDHWLECQFVGRWKFQPTPDKP